MWEALPNAGEINPVHLIGSLSNQDDEVRRLLVGLGREHSTSDDKLVNCLAHMGRVCLPFTGTKLRQYSDKLGEWNRWYRHAIPEAKQLYAAYLKEREQEKGDGRG